MKQVREIQNQIQEAERESRNRAEKQKRDISEVIKLNDNVADLYIFQENCKNHLQCTIHHGNFNCTYPSNQTMYQHMNAMSSLLTKHEGILQTRWNLMWFNSRSTV